jgi:hypothetical protein
MTVYLSGGMYSDSVKQIPAEVWLPSILEYSAGHQFESESESIDIAAMRGRRSSVCTLTYRILIRSRVVSETSSNKSGGNHASTIIYFEHSWVDSRDRAGGVGLHDDG